MTNKYTNLQKIITNFMSADAKVRFYESAVDGTPCVEWLQFSQWHNATVVDLARRIHRHKKSVIAQKKRIAQKKALEIA